MEERVGYIMKSMLSKMVKKVHRDDRGLSLVEVLCAVAILALVTGVIGSVIVISTRTYRRGISETNIQQEAQLAANNIGNIVKDACSVIYGTGDSSAPDYNGGYYFKNGDLSERVPEGGDFKKQTEGYTELSIITNDKVQYTMTYDEHNEMLLYREYDTETGNPRTDSEIMAQNIVSFAADTADFKKNKTIKLNMTVEDKDTNRQIPMEYTMTSRNGEGEGGTYVSSTDDVVIVFVEGDVVMVPGETYQIPITVSGKLREGLEWGTVTGLTPGALTLTYAEVTVPLDTTDLTGSLEIHTRDKKEDSSPKATASSNVRIRRVNQVAVSHSINREHSTGHMIETTGAEYMFSANVTGNELAKNVAYNYDSDYKTAQAVLWSWVMEIDGTELARREWTGAQNASGQWEFTPHDTGRAQFDEYIEIMSEKEDVLLPEFGLRLKKDLPAGFKLTVRATSKHALGVNKADSRYYDALSSDPKDIYYGEDVIEPRETILNSDLEIILEPQETGRVALGMKGGITDRVTFDYHNATDVRSDANPNGTTVTYDAAADEAVITLGKDEKGSGALATGDKYTFTVDALVNGVKKSTITVRVCRIDELSIEVFDNFTGKDNQLQKLPTYDFRARFNVSDGKNDATMQSAIKHLIQYKEDGTPDKSVVEKTLSSRITWELIDYNANGEIVYSDSVICMAGVGASDKGEVKGKYEKERKGYYQVVNIKPSRIEQNPDGTWFIKQLPEIDISPEADTPTGLPANYELKVTIEALHPLATVSSVTYNKTGEPYGVAEASASVKGDLTIDTPTKLVIVEPGQGTNDKTSSDKEMIVPIQVHGNAVYRMEAKISGNSSNGTKLSSYTDKDRYGNTNPYMAGNSTSAAQMRTWYMGLLIDENEKGDSNGRIQIHIDAYNSQNKVIAYTDFELGVRRVDKVDVRVVDGKKIEDINKEGSKVKLEALPKGRGNNGTEFYDIQKDEKGGICRWEQKGHGEYIEPSPMEWTMLINKTEKPLSEWTEYFETDNDKAIKTAVNKDAHKATVEFTLKQPLPNGTKIRAYSLHARGDNGKKETDSAYEKYNKSGKEYGDVYGELAFDEGLIVVSGGWKRGGTLDIAYNIPEENITYVDGKPFLVKDGQILWEGAIATRISFKSKYNGVNQQGNHLFQSPSLFTHNPYDNGQGVGGERGEALFEGKTLTEYTATIYAWGDRLDKTSYSAPYTKGDGSYIDLSSIELKVNVGTTNVDATDTIAVDEKTYYIPDVVFQYQNSLPETSKQSGDSDGAWTKKSDNTLKVYVTPDDTISGYKSYYKLSEGWEETYEKYTLLLSRYVGVINDDKKDDSRDERLFDFAVTNTTGEGIEEGRSFVNFVFSKDVRSQYKGKVVKMIYEYNPYLCNTKNSSSEPPYAWAYEHYKKEQLDEIDGCEGILEFHFVDANINTKAGVVMPEVRYCPTYSENKTSATPNYYYISTDSRFYINSDGKTAQYQTGGVGKWETKYSMTYANSKWTIN